MKAFTCQAKAVTDPTIDYNIRMDILKVSGCDSDGDPHSRELRIRVSQICNGFLGSVAFFVSLNSVRRQHHPRPHAGGYGDF